MILLIGLAMIVHAPEMIKSQGLFVFRQEVVRWSLILPMLSIWIKPWP